MTTRGTKRTSVGRIGPEDGLGKRIQVARNKEGLKAAELARIAGIHRATLKHYESGERFPGAKELRRICDALGKSPNELIYGADVPVSFGAKYKHEDPDDWTVRLPALVRAVSGFMRLPANDQMAFSHVINSTADQYYNSGDRQKMEEFIQILMPQIQAIASGDKNEFLRAVEQMRQDFDTGINDENES